MELRGPMPTVQESTPVRNRLTMMNAELVPTNRSRKIKINIGTDKGRRIFGEDLPSARPVIHGGFLEALGDAL
jgi:hypothetical protein